MKKGGASDAGMGELCDQGDDVGEGGYVRNLHRRDRVWLRSVRHYLGRGNGIRSGPRDVPRDANSFASISLPPTRAFTPSRRAYVSLKKRS